MIGTVMRRLVTALACLGSGLLVAAALPPWGWWPLAFAGLVALDRLIADRPRGSRFRRGAVAGVGLYVPSLAWMIDMTVPGYAIAALAYAALLGVAAALVPARAPARWIGLPGAVAVVELLRWSWPFGGVPLSSLAVGQVAGPLAPVLRLGGALLLVEVTVVAAVALAAALSRRWRAAAFDGAPMASK
jgi:apolipoprotein N-acyltransferase